VLDKLLAEERKKKNNNKKRCKHNKSPKDYVWNFQNGHRQNAKKLKNTKIIIAGYSPNRN
jgi:hypothetical protein